MMGIEFVDDDEPEDPDALLRVTIKLLFDEFGEMDEDELAVAYGSRGVEIYRELKNAGN